MYQLWYSIKCKVAHASRVSLLVPLVQTDQRYSVSLSTILSYIVIFSILKPLVTLRYSNQPLRWIGANLVVGRVGLKPPYCWKPHRAPPTFLWSWMKDKRRKSGRCTVNRWLTMHTCIGARAGRGGRWGDGYVRIGRRERSPYLQFWICPTFSHNKSTPTPPSSQAKPIRPASGWCWFVLWEKVFVTGVWCWFV
jgi:hypothetical protein